MPNFPDNVLYEMDNLEVLRGMNSETVDLIATDPPFNTKRNRSGTAGEYVDNWKWGDTNILPDQWKWNEVHPKWLEEIQDDNPVLHQVIETTRVSHAEDTAAFLCFLSVRLLEMHRILKPTGSIYLHCDHTANAYIRLCMDAIFGKDNFRNEIVWTFRTGGVSLRYYPRKHHSIFFYVKSDAYVHNPIKERIYYEKPFFTNEQDEDGRYFADVYVRDVWQDIKPLINVSGERTGSPDQKPLALYERMIEVSSSEGDLVLDPFCGCATTIIAARNLKRRWVGIDRRVDAKYHVVARMAGIDAEERDRMIALNSDWAVKQMEKYEAHYAEEAPKRTDDGDEAAPELASVFPVAREYEMRHEKMHSVLIDQFGLRCWGCDFEAPDPRYLELDHIDPKSGSTSKYLDLLSNRALLCRPCNQKKSNRITLIQLRRENKNESYLIGDHPIDLDVAREWTWEYVLNEVRNSPHQYNLEGR